LAVVELVLAVAELVLVEAGLALTAVAAPELAAVEALWAPALGRLL